MATAETTTFADNIKTLGDSIVKLTVLEAKALGDYLERSTASRPPPPRWSPARPRPRRRRRARRGQDRVRRRPGDLRRQQDQRHQGRPGRHRPGPEGGQGPGRGRPQGGQDRHLQGRRREAQEGAGGGRRHRQDQVIRTPARSSVRDGPPPRPGPRAVGGRCRARSGSDGHAPAPSFAAGAAAISTRRADGDGARPLARDFVRPILLGPEGGQGTVPRPGRDAPAARAHPSPLRSATAMPTHDHRAADHPRASPATSAGSTTSTPSPT